MRASPASTNERRDGRRLTGREIDGDLWRFTRSDPACSTSIAIRAPGGRPNAAPGGTSIALCHGVHPPDVLPALEHPTSSALSRQHGDHAGQTGDETGALALAIDGAHTPEAISDDYAYTLFLGAMASRGAGAWQTALRSAGIEQEDAVRFGAALAPLSLELGAIAQQRAAGSDGGALHERERNALATARARVESTLSADGRARLDQYVREHVKSRIRIYRGAMPAPAQR